MRSYFKILPLILFLHLGIIVNCTGNNSNTPSFCLFNSSRISLDSSLICMKRSNPINYHLIVIFRNGVDEKNILFSYPLKSRPSFNNNNLTSVVPTNAGHVKHILSFSHCLALQPEFLSSSSFRSPPMLY